MCELLFSGFDSLPRHVTCSVSAVKRSLSVAVSSCVCHEVVCVRPQQKEILLEETLQSLEAAAVCSAVAVCTVAVVFRYISVRVIDNQREAGSMLAWKVLLVR